MLILGLLLVVVSGAAAAVLIAGNSGGTAEPVTAFGREIADVTMMQSFVAGIVVALVFLLGLWMVVSAGRRGRENRTRYLEARREAKTATKERDELASQLHKDEERRDTEPATPASRRSADPDANQQPVITNTREGQPPAR